MRRLPIKVATAYNFYNKPGRAGSVGPVQGYRNPDQTRKQYRTAVSNAAVLFYGFETGDGGKCGTI